MSTSPKSHPTVSFSAVIPCYNAAPHITDCLASLVAATGSRSVEIIIVDDGSTDGTAETVRLFFDRAAQKATHPHFTHIAASVRILTQRNRGVSAARNHGLDAARGEYVCFIDADDCVSDTYFQALDHSLIESGADVLRFGYTTVSPDSPLYVPPPWDVNLRSTAEVIEQAFPKYIGASYGALARWQEFATNPRQDSDWGAVWAFAYRRQLLTDNHIRFDPAIKVNEDELFNAEVMLRAQSFATIPDPLYVYRPHANGAMRRPRSLPEIHANKVAMLARRDRLVQLKREICGSGDPNEYAGALILDALQMAAAIRFTNFNAWHRSVRLFRDYLRQPSVRHGLSTASLRGPVWFRVALLLLKLRLGAALFMLILAADRLGLHISGEL